MWLSGVTYDAPATLTDTSFALHAAGAERPTMLGTLTAEGRLRVRFVDAAGRTEHEATLVKQ